jgi:hypothetical protein
MIPAIKIPRAFKKKTDHIEHHKQNTKRLVWGRQRWASTATPSVVKLRYEVGIDTSPGAATFRTW